MWANQIMLQWDAYLDGSDTLQHSFFIYHPPKYFKRLDEDSYRHYRQAMQLLDCALLDVQTLQYTPRVLVCSLLFLVLGTPSATQASSSGSSISARSPRSSPAPPASSWRSHPSSKCSNNSSVTGSGWR